METFPWPTSKNCQMKRAPKVLENEFGEGYTQRLRNGINHNLRVFPVEFPDMDLATMNAIDAFLDARGGDEAFLWAAPHEDVVRKWICKTWDATPGDLHTWVIKAEFREVPA